ncbi:sensor histidine kinase [Microbacterium sp. A196]|uniref:sensor histidine kinase n=1 Tax=unclassified Microbacterium TaxID=2609290 RepID=UPI003FD1E921
MRRLGTEGWAGLVMVAAALGVSSPALFGAADTSIPRPVWAGVLVMFGVGVLCAVMANSVLRFIGYGAGVVAAWVLVITADMGLVLILLVVTAAISVYIVPLWGGLLVVALNTVAVGVTYSQKEQPLLDVIMMIGFYLLIQLASLFSSATLVREQQLRAQLTVAHVELQVASVLLSESARTAERLRISRDLHDLIGHQLTALTLQLETARHVDGAAVRSHIDNADMVARELLRDVRATVTQLRAHAPDLSKELGRIGDGIPGLTVTVHVADGVRADEHASTAFVRATQEVITNAVRHADAKEIWIEITSDDRYTTFVAHDDGHGTAKPVLGNGLRGLRERFGELGGTFEIDGSSGFRVTARVAHP